MNHVCERESIVEVCRRMYLRGLISGGQGNVSVRLGSDSILITPTGVNKGFVKPEELVVADMNGSRIENAVGAGAVSSEIKVHLAAYRARTDCRAVVHAHPVTSVALTLAGVSLEPVYLPESAVTLGIVPTGSYATPSSTELARCVEMLAASHNVIMMERHGAVCLGPDPFIAYDRLESLEHNSRILLMARLAGTPRPLPDDEIARLMTIAEGMRR